MQKHKEYPDKGEYVICTVTKLNPNSAFAGLMGYNKEGMIHVSEISSSWVRDIRNHLKVGQKIVAKVLYVDYSKDMIALSVKRVKPTIKREKISEYKNEKKAENLLKIVSKNLKKSLEEAYKEVGFKIQEKYGLIYPAFELAASEGKNALIEIGINKKWAEEIEKIAKKNIKPKEVSIKATLVLKCFKPNGVDIIKNALDVKAENVKIIYISAPNYSINVKGKDYQSCEKILNELSNKIITSVKENGGEGEIIRK